MKHLKKIPAKIASWIGASAAWLLLCSLSVFIIWVWRDRAGLIRDNENERVFSALFADLRNYDSAESLIESNSLLQARIKGFALYRNDLSAASRWGNAPDVFDASLIGETRYIGRFGRYTIPNRKSRSVTFVLKTDRIGPPPPVEERPPLPPDIHDNRRGRVSEPRPQERRNAPRNPFSFMTGIQYIYIDISHESYWSTMLMTEVLSPFIILVLAAAVLFIRRLYIRNIEYRDRIEAQKNLVVLGTAAGTIAHEIKNPLLSIRLQTSILEKALPDAANNEINIINEEVDRLASLVQRVGDYLREGTGNAVTVDAAALLAETGERLCARNILAGRAPPAFVRADPERLRSVFANIVRNAIESTSPLNDISASVEQTNAAVHIIISDKGKGIAEDDLERVFDPFFTRKSTGTGIGLSVSKRFVEAAGGTITIANREGGGVNVTVTLPLAAAAASQTASAGGRRTPAD
ncbi:MAG: HAMP domain-containing histidine kinase [Treponema sp.]|jgi:two-component system sensor histidine kinase HydH|nr:HAMP domain-containing histidine kinase [Treponema sp.]